MGRNMLVAPVDGQDDVEIVDSPAVHADTDARQVVGVPGASEVPRPARPGDDEVRRHNLTHLPHAAWCDVCCRARTVDDRHMLQPQVDGVDSLPKIECDYGEVKMKAGTPPVKVLVFVDGRTGYLGVIDVEQKGGGSTHAVRWAAKWIESTGYARVRVQCDAEQAIDHLLKNVKGQCSIDIVVQKAPAKSHASQGHVERAVRLVENQYRALLFGLQDVAKVEFEPTSPASSWLLRHSAWTLNRYGSHKGGATPYERLYGYAYKSPVLPIFSMVQCLIPSDRKPGGVLVVAKGVPRTFLATWVGRAEESDEHLVVNEVGHVVRVRCVRRCVEKEMDPERITQLVATPSFLKPTIGGDEVAEEWTPTPGCKACESAHGNKRSVKCEARRYEYKLKFGRNPPPTRRIPRQVVGTEGAQLPQSAEQAPSGPSVSSTGPSESHVRPSAGPPPTDDATMSDNRLVPADVDLSWRVREKRSPAAHSEHEQVLKHRRLDDDGGMVVGAVHADHPEVDPMEFHDWHCKERDGKVAELLSQDTFLSMHGVPANSVKGKEIIKTRWVLKDQGDKVKARLVMKHFNTWKDEEGEFYAGTPLPTSFNLLLALAAKRVALGMSQTIACLDVSTAFLHADMKDEIYLKLDPSTLQLIREEKLKNIQPADDEGYYRVDKAIYGYRGAPKLWKEAVRDAALEFGPKPSVIDSSVYMGESFFQYVHVDDELLSGDDATVRGIVALIRERFLVKKIDYLCRAGDRVDILGRTIERTAKGYRIITNGRYIDQCLKDMDVESCKPVSTPSMNVTEKEWDGAEDLPTVIGGLYRRVVGRLLYVAGQRPDVQQAVKELARGMAKPNNVHWARLKRTLRYLASRRVAVWKFEPTIQQARSKQITATCDSDWGGCAQTRRSTTGIVLRYAGSTIATMSRTQGGVSLSSGEAEYYAMVSALAEAKQVQEVLGEYGEDSYVVIETDSSVAKSSAERPGSGKMKHIAVKYRYLQEAVQNQEVKVSKIGTKNNVADAMTKGVGQDILRRMMTTLEIELYGDYQQYMDYRDDKDKANVAVIAMITAEKSVQLASTLEVDYEDVKLGVADQVDTGWILKMLFFAIIWLSYAVELEAEIRRRGIPLPGQRQTKTSLTNTLLLCDLTELISELGRTTTGRRSGSRTLIAESGTSVDVESGESSGVGRPCLADTAGGGAARVKGASRWRPPA